MPEETFPQEILVITGPTRPDYSDLEIRRDFDIRRTPNIEIVQLNKLQGQVNIFLQQLNQVMAETPEKVGGFRLDQFEVTAGIVVEAGGGVKLALFANAEASVAVNAGLKFVFKRSSE